MARRPSQNRTPLTRHGRRRFRPCFRLSTLDYQPRTSSPLALFHVRSHFCGCPVLFTLTKEGSAFCEGWGGHSQLSTAFPHSCLSAAIGSSWQHVAQASACAPRLFLSTLDYQPRTSPPLALFHVRSHFCGCPILNVFCEGWGLSSLAYSRPLATCAVIPRSHATRDLLYSLCFSNFSSHQSLPLPFTRIAAPLSDPAGHTWHRLQPVRLWSFPFNSRLSTIHISAPLSGPVVTLVAPAKSSPQIQSPPE